MTFDYFLDLFKKNNIKNNTMVVVCPHQENMIMAIKEATEYKIIQKTILIGDERLILNLLKKQKIEKKYFEIINSLDLKECADLAIEKILSKKANILMKGLIDTSILLHAILLEKEKMLIQKTLCHVGILFKEGQEKF